MSSPDIDTRIAISLAVARYLRAVDHFEAATQEFNAACSTLRDQLPQPSRFVTRIDCKYYLVTTDRDRNFEVEELELL